MTTTRTQAPDAGIIDSPLLWAAIAAPLPPEAISWRQDGRPTERAGKHFARFVAFIDAQFVRERLDEIVPGNWDSALELLPPVKNAYAEGVPEVDELVSFKCRLTILGVSRESAGTGKDYKTADTDAFKRAAVRYGIGAELYAYGPNYVQVESDSKYAKPVEDPGVVYARRQAKANGEAPASAPAAPAPAAPRQAEAQPSAPPAPAQAPAQSEAASSGEEVMCPDCGGKTYDNRATKKNPKAPDYRCRDRNCQGIVWPPRETAKPVAKRSNEKMAHSMSSSDQPVPF